MSLGHMMGKRRVVAFSEEAGVIEKLDEFAKRWGTSRSALIRRAVREFLERLQKGGGGGD